MDILFLLVPLSVVLVLALLALFAWALWGGQFDNVDREGERILWDDKAPEPARVDADQARLAGAREE
ncbi:cbb3-type cytochrome oxidase assembly protein CcoS [Aquabacterium sp. A7-Y]|uniref:cbb3-type cytochrome oxidase assembly protein CcoS n=1 Tax=Aquabacterium sp. A7-Y TaxID=1349605 RepID=UPI00223CDE75|nr:cbb3-type cytochrome oxidase assembly protein CcoS [Aquabacterium sp. A7-Y]MCW7537774.1 cbb3-type cytochrome oxidase assembly protein CcoS [Aquabacterium sp. A7-Y]